ncbi:hypothetical protein G6O69_36765 [Pseudenhygromyxa sp. WMMC2535]|uniref:hypothetical protein n=1 Tax=Pseudenhygromyxa sp. WMMC2535 TaxID=2712867 RepID=UPI0015557487|nr:hypothetical protein [Pseudenhygromyxa sp. WMMC2535]NVB43434.1 hypothetical protein [Pseudenhygromyxa sp. WMMC2535]
MNFGRLVYFAHVRELLQRAFESRGLDVEIHRVRTGPVASLRQRAGDLAEVIRTEIPRVSRCTSSATAPVASTRA